MEEKPCFVYYNNSIIEKQVPITGRRERAHEKEMVE